ncbi:MAG: flavoprotein, partial [Methylocystaceae bacterium]
MEQERFFELVVQEVLRRLTEPTGLNKEKVLVVFTGGVIGLDKAVEELKIIQNLNNVDLKVILSHSAEKVIGVKRLKQELGEQIDIITAQEPYPRKVLEETDLIIVPVLTMNTAAKVALLLADTPVCTLVLQALLRGKPVIAAKNAADPDDYQRVMNNMNRANSALRAALQSQLTKLETYGVTLVPVEKLAEMTSKALAKEVKTITKVGKKTIIDAETVRKMAEDGIEIIHLDKGT